MKTTAPNTCNVPLTCALGAQREALMRMTQSLRILLASAAVITLLFPAASGAETSSQATKQIALTFDDLPYVPGGHPWTIERAQRTTPNTMRHVARYLNGSVIHLEDETMNSEFEALQGECRCGRIRFQITAPPIITMACHCTGCQRMSASAFSLSAAIPSDAFSITQGEPVIGGLHGALHHFFCGYCMSWIFTRIDGFDSFVNIRVTMLDDPSPFPPYIETYTSEKLPWATTPAVHSFAQFPPLEHYEGLAAEYASHVRGQA